MHALTDRVLVTNVLRILLHFFFWLHERAGEHVEEILQCLTQGRLLLRLWHHRDRRLSHGLLLMLRASQEGARLLHGSPLVRRRRHHVVLRAVVAAKLGVARLLGLPAALVLREELARRDAYLLLHV